MNFTLKDSAPDSKRTVKGKIVNGKVGLEVYVDGYGVAGMAAGHGSPIFLEVWEGKLRLHVFADINSEEPTHSIDLEGALETARKLDDEVPDSFDPKLP